ncbi:MAG: xanthine dehydrogenase small subunit [Pseudomonadota bacterium]
MRNTVRFVHDGSIVQINNVDPTRTVLQYLREDVVKTGTKEGCAEGDCGACMVVIASLTQDHDALDYRAVNACIQFIGTLDGKELITIESLSKRGGALHPAQQAMVDCHGSQCGFCTPGFVMSLFALYKQRGTASRNDIDDTISGNLCRCTGYRPIVDAASAMMTESVATDQRHWQRGDTAASDAATIRQLVELSNDDPLHATSGHRQFIAPRTREALAQHYADHPDATLLAGGTDVGLWVTKQYRDLDTVIYLGNVAGLDNIEVTDVSIDVGAAVTFSALAPVLLDYYPELADLIRRWASAPVRNAATLGGNIANGSPIGDSMPVLIALDTTLTLRKGDQSRTLPLESLYHAYQDNDLGPGEFVETVHIPLPKTDQFVRSYKLSKRFDQDISAVCTGFALSLNNDNTVANVRLAFGGVAGTPIRAVHCEAALTGATFDEATIRNAMAVLRNEFTPLSDMRASSDYRRETTANLLYRFFIEVTQPEVATDVYNFGR